MSTLRPKTRGLCARSMADSFIQSAIRAPASQAGEERLRVKSKPAESRKLAEGAYTLSYAPLPIVESGTVTSVFETFDGQLARQ